MVERSTASVVQGWWAEFAEAVVRQLPRDMDPITADKWIWNPQALKKVLHEVLSPTPSQPTRNIYPVVVDYEKSVEEMVKLGRYDCSNKAITSKNFPSKRNGREKIQIELVCLDRNMSTDEWLKEFDGMGFRPAEIHELLAFGEKYPDVQRKFPVVAFGSVWRSPSHDYLVPYLSGFNFSGFNFKRRLDLGSVKFNWLKIDRFAVVRKERLDLL